MAEKRRDLGVWLIVVAIVLLIGNLVFTNQVKNNVTDGEHAADHAQIAAARAAVAAEQASKDLTTAIEASRSPQATERWTKAFASLTLVEQILCSEFPASCTAARATPTEGPPP